MVHLPSEKSITRSPNSPIQPYSWSPLATSETFPRPAISPLSSALRHVSANPTTASVSAGSPSVVAKSPVPPWCSVRSLPCGTAPICATSTNASDPRAARARLLLPLPGSSSTQSSIPSGRAGCSRIFPISNLKLATNHRRNKQRHLNRKDDNGRKRGNAHTILFSFNSINYGGGKDRSLPRMYHEYIPRPFFTRFGHNIKFSILVGIAFMVRVYDVSL